MVVELQPNAARLTSDEIRMFLRDTPEWNILHDDVVFKDADIQLAIKLTVSKWNAITPMSDVVDPNLLNEYVLLCGVCGFLLKSEGIRQMQNQMMVQDGNVAPAGLDEKEGIYMKWAMHFQEEFQAKAQMLKVAMNMESLLGDPFNWLGSGYRYIGKYSG
jgi:hypothetical protein